MWETITSTLVGFAGHALGALKTAAGFIAARVLAALGLTFVNYQYVLPEVKGWITPYLSAIPGSVGQLTGALGVDVFMIMILSALVARVGMRAFLVGVEQLQSMIGQAGG